jgi:hypothetical protein
LEVVSAALAFQRAARAVLIADATVTALVPADNVIDANGRPEVFPCIRLGEDQELPGDDVVGRYTDLFATLHIWTREPGLADAKAIAGAVRRALALTTWSRDGYRCIDTRLDSARFLRDPDGVTGHGIVTFKAVIEEL